MIQDTDLLTSLRELVHLYLKILRTDLHINLPQEFVLRKVYCIPIDIVKEIVENRVKNSEKICIISQVINSIIDVNQVNKIEIVSLREWLKDPPRRSVKRNQS